jgi:hypothetical protein
MWGRAVFLMLYVSSTASTGRDHHSAKKNTIQPKKINFDHEITEIANAKSHHSSSPGQNPA